MDGQNHNQIFPRWLNLPATLSLFAPVLALAGIGWACLEFTRSPYGTGIAEQIVQNPPFSHKHHAGDLGIDCRYCHTSVEDSSFAGIPPTKTCMNCHSQIWTGAAAVVDPVRNSYDTGESLRWKRIYNLPGFVYFEHSVHVQKGIGCATCHGRVDTMPYTSQATTLLMEWCIDCHRNPEKQLRPREEVFNMSYQQPKDQLELGRTLMEAYKVRNTDILTSCTFCHR